MLIGLDKNKRTAKLMKKLFIITIAILTILGLGATALAQGKATIYFSPESKEVLAGNSFNISIMVNPNGESLDTVRAIVNYPADKLEAVYFNLGNAYPNQSPGNYIDNSQGILSQGGAIFGGQTSKTGTFGTITFKALQAGEAAVSLNEDSKLIKSGQEKIDLSSLGKAVITIKSQAAEGAIAEELKKPGHVIAESSTQPDQNQWYSSNKVELKWKMSDGSEPAVAYLYDLDQDPQTNPTKLLDSTGSKTIDILDDGIWYFHIKARFAGQKYSDATHYRIMVDSSAPQKIVPIFDNAVINENEMAQLRFGTIDQVSGINFYEVAVDGGTFEKQTSPYTVKGLKAGDHMAIVRAVDKAGNVTANAATITVNPLTQEEKRAYWWGKYKMLIASILLILILILLLAIRRKINQKSI